MKQVVAGPQRYKAVAKGHNMDEKQCMTIRDIVEELGLSTTAVSNVIYGKTKKISDETVNRVQALLEERQYIPSMAGILLAQNSSKIIGVFVNDHEKYEGHTLDDVFIASSLNYLSTEIETHVRDDGADLNYSKTGWRSAVKNCHRKTVGTEGKTIEPCITLPVTLIKRESTR